MTEVVTSSAASVQLNLLAQRQQVFAVPVERQGVESGFVTADLAAASADTSQDASAQANTSDDDQNPVNHHQDEVQQRAREPAPAPTGPSKARIEIKHIDLGLTPSEVVGTTDILQRFDSNGDGHIDQAEAARAGIAREGVFTYAGLGSANQKPEEHVATVATTTADDTTDATPQPGTPPQTAVAPDAAPVTTTVHGKKIFTAEEAGAGIGKKFFNAVAAQGTPTGHADAPKKFYGQGAEVVVGKFAAESTTKISDKAVSNPKIVATDDSGETKLYDKVAQTDTGQTSDGGDTPDTTTPQQQQPKTAPEESAPVVKKTGHKVVAAYVPETTSTTTVVTA